MFTNTFSDKRQAANLKRQQRGSGRFFGVLGVKEAQKLNSYEMMRASASQSCYSYGGGLA